MAMSPAQFPRAVRAAPAPLGWYVRPSYVDDRAIANAVASASAGGLRRRWCPARGRSGGAVRTGKVLQRSACPDSLHSKAPTAPWLNVDARLTVLLRQYLDRADIGGRQWQVRSWKEAWWG